MDIEESKQPQTVPDSHSENEEFFSKMSYYLHDSAAKVNDEPASSLPYLYYRMVQLRDLFRSLERPWLDFVSLVHRESLVAVLADKEPKPRKKHVQLTNDLVAFLCNMSKNRKVIHKMSVFYSNQVEELSALLRQKNIEISGPDNEDND